MSMSIPKYVSSFLIGAAVGAGIALMVTPIPGKRLQRKVAKIGDHMADKFDDMKAAVQRVAS